MSAKRMKIVSFWRIARKKDSRFGYDSSELNFSIEKYQINIAITNISNNIITRNHYFNSKTFNFNTNT